jgi:hypothetical protein
MRDGSYASPESSSGKNRRTNKILCVFILSNIISLLQGSGSVRDEQTGMIQALQGYAWARYLLSPELLFLSVPRATIARVYVHTLRSIVVRRTSTGLIRPNNRLVQVLEEGSKIAVQEFQRRLVQALSKNIIVQECRCGSRRPRNTRLAPLHNATVRFEMTKQALQCSIELSLP